MNSVLDSDYYFDVENLEQAAAQLRAYGCAVIRHAMSAEEVATARRAVEYWQTVHPGQLKINTKGFVIGAGQSEAMWRVRGSPEYKYVLSQGWVPVGTAAPTAAALRRAYPGLEEIWEGVGVEAAAAAVAAAVTAAALVARPGPYFFAN